MSRYRWRSTQLTGRNISVLGAYRRLYLGGREVETGKLVGIKPDTHGIRLTEHLNISYTGDAAQRIKYFGVQEIVHGEFIDATIGRVDTDNHQKPGVPFGDFYSLLLDLLREV